MLHDFLCTIQLILNTVFDFFKSILIVPLINLEQYVKNKDPNDEIIDYNILRVGTLFAISILSYPICHSKIP